MSTLDPADLLRALRVAVVDDKALWDAVAMIPVSAMEKALDSFRCPDCAGAGTIDLPFMRMRYPSVCASCEGSGVEVVDA